MDDGAAISHRQASARPPRMPSPCDWRDLVCDSYPISAPATHFADCAKGLAACASRLLGASAKTRLGPVAGSLHASPSGSAPCTSMIRIPVLLPYHSFWYTDQC